ncbi:MAG: 4-hydroxythreonine-4-phosphate dehydrogenase PdxA [Elusimicrobiota bacterium]
MGVRVLITQGDPSGIGPEVIVKAVRNLNKKERDNILLVGDRDIFIKAGWNSNLCSIIPTEVFGFRLIKSTSNAFSGKLSFKSLDVALKILESKRADALVTAPISKKSWDMAGIKYPGHTEYFRKKFGKDLLMCFNKDKMNFALLTEHIPLKDVSRYVTQHNIKLKITLLKEMISFFNFSKNPIILVAGLNPHCGDGGVIGMEEKKYIIPAIRAMKKSGVKVFGPYNPDDIFEKYFKMKANGAIFMYHEQLIPLLKVISKKNDIVHITWGLDFIRTSPAHGTAFDIAWKNIADETSMYKAIKTAMMLIRRKNSF